MCKRIALVTDFGVGGPYVGQMMGVLDAAAPGVRTINLISDLVPYRPDLAAYLLPQLIVGLPDNTLYICVVDPGVGCERAVVALQADSNWYLAPDNGLLAMVAQRATRYSAWLVTWRPSRLSASFHGRDLFAPLAAAVATGQGHKLLDSPVDFGRLVGHDWPPDAFKIIYHDHYGNLCSGIRADQVLRTAYVHAGGQRLAFARTFGEVNAGIGFWYENAFGLLELAVNQGAANRILGLVPGDPVVIG